jgi:RNA ligase (TIGR02306 family)
MNTLRVEIVEINEIQPHPNADRLEIAYVKGWSCVVKKDEFKVGDKVIYFPIDCVLPPNIETAIFGIDSKIKLHHSRVRTIKLRGAVSQGLIIDMNVLGIKHGTMQVGEDLTSYLGVTKYEPSVSDRGSCTAGAQASKKQVNPNFRKYTDIENFKNYPSVFEEGEDVCITEKIHGTNFRAGYVLANGFFSKIKSYLTGNKGYEFVFGSHNVQLQDKGKKYDGFYDSNVYAKIVKQCDLKKILKRGEVIYGEIYGPGIQKNYTYGCAPGEHELIVFDVTVDGEYLSVYKWRTFCVNRGLEFVPILYEGHFNINKAKELTIGDSMLCPAQDIREGVVIKPLKEQKTYMGRKILKLISDEYLLRKGNTENH